MNDVSHDFWSVVKRGTMCRCPRCGKGKLYASYLKQMQQCTECSEDLGQYRADDGPAWLTILIVGHMMVPFIMALVKHPEWPQEMMLGVFLVMTVVSVMALMPFTKGFFIAMLWRNKHAG